MPGREKVATKHRSVQKRETFWEGRTAGKVTEGARETSKGRKNKSAEQAIK